MNIQDCIFSNITNEAINDGHASPHIEHNTFNNCNKAIHLTAATLSTYTLKNNIINNCSIDVHIVDVTKAILSYSLSNGNRINCDIDTNSKENLLPLFIDEQESDFKLQNKLNGYFLDSPAVLLADDSRDAGAWDYTYTINSTEWDSEEVKDDYGRLIKELPPITPVEKSILNGSLRNYARAFLNRFIVMLSEAANTMHLYKLERLLRKTGLKKLYPVGSGKINKTSCQFTQIAEENGNTYFQCTVPSGQLPILENENISGLFLVCNTNPPSYTGNLPKYIFKIISESNGVLTLEQIYKDYTYSADWSSNIDIWKSIWLGGVQYKGTEDLDNITYYKFDYSVGNTDWQSLQDDQAKGWMLRINLGSTYYYFRCYRNDDQYIWCEDIFSNASSLVVSNYYNALIDFIFVRQVLETVKGNQVNENTGWKCGGEWFATKFTIQNGGEPINTLPQNWGNGASITLQETKEYDEDGI